MARKNVKAHPLKKNPAAHAEWLQQKKLRNSEGVKLAPKS